MRMVGKLSPRGNINLQGYGKGGLHSFDVLYCQTVDVTVMEIESLSICEFLEIGNQRSNDQKKAMHNPLRIPKRSEERGNLQRGLKFNQGCDITCVEWGFTKLSRGLMRTSFLHKSICHHFQDPSDLSMHDGRK